MPPLHVYGYSWLCTNTHAEGPGQLQWPLLSQLTYIHSVLFLGSSNLIRDKYRAACLLLRAIPASLFFRCFHFFLCRLAAPARFR